VQQVRLGGRFAAFFTTSQYRDSFKGSVQEFNVATGKRILHVTRGSTDTRPDDYGSTFAPDFVSLEARHGFLAWRAVESYGPYVRHVVITVTTVAGTASLTTSTTPHRHRFCSRHRSFLVRAPP